MKEYKTITIDESEIHLNFHADELNKYSSQGWAVKFLLENIKLHGVKIYRYLLERDKS